MSKTVRYYGIKVKLTAEWIERPKLIPQPDSQEEMHISFQEFAPILLLYLLKGDDLIPPAF
jgi:hypothetical protein